MAIKAPTVAKLSDLVSTYAKAFAPQSTALDNQLQTAQQDAQGQQAGLTAQKDQAFGQIEQNASNKGEYFSGFSPNAQAGYLGSTYLPALAKLQTAIATTRDNIIGKKADLSSQAYQGALGEQQRESGVLADWNKMTKEQQFNASEAQKQRVFQAQQAAKQNAFQAAQNAASRAASASSSGPSISAIKFANSQAASAAEKAAILKLSKVASSHAGSDGYLSPNDYNAAKREFLAAGYDSAAFDSHFAGYRNPGNPYYGVK